MDRAIIAILAMTMLLLGSVFATYFLLIQGWEKDVPQHQEADKGEEVNREIVKQADANGHEDLYHPSKNLEDGRDRDQGRGLDFREIDPLGDHGAY